MNDNNTIIYKTTLAWSSSISSLKWLKKTKQKYQKKKTKQQEKKKPLWTKSKIVKVSKLLQPPSNKSNYCMCNDCLKNTL